MRLIAIVSAAVAAVAMASDPGVANQIVTDYPVAVACTSTGQLCAPPYSVTVNTIGTLKVQYFVHPGHCSSVRVHFLLDGPLVVTSPFLGYIGDPLNQPMQTIEYDLGPVSPGSHKVEIQAEGQPGGCNSGGVATWGGTLRITTAEDKVPTAPATWSGIKARYR